MIRYIKERIIIISRYPELIGLGSDNSILPVLHIGQQEGSAFVIRFKTSQ